MQQDASTPAAEPPRAVKMNTRLTHRPDVTDVEHPLVEGSLALMDRLARRELTVDAFQAEIADLHRRLDLPRSLAAWIERAITEQKNQTLYRRTRDAGRETIQLFYIEPGEVHPPHCHHNVVSSQVVLQGHIREREYDRVTRLADGSILLRRRSDGRFGVGEGLNSTEVDKNCHWFAAEAEPVIMLNFNIYGYQDWTFNPKDQPFQRNLVDPTFGTNPDGLIIARDIAVEDAYAKFGGRPLDDFPNA